MIKYDNHPFYLNLFSWDGHISKQSAGVVFAKYLRETESKSEIEFDKAPVYDHSNERYRVIFLCGTVYYAVQGGSNFKVCG